MSQNRVNEIGKQTPIEVFQDCLDLHGEMIQHVHNCSNTDFNHIVDDFKKFIEANTELLSDYLVGDYKKILNHKIRTGIETIGSHAEIFSDLENKAQEKKEEEKKKAKKKSQEVKRCSVCGFEKDLNDFPSHQNGKLMKTCNPCRDKRHEKMGKRREEDNEIKKTVLEELREKNAKLTAQLEKCQEEKPKVNYIDEQEWLAQQEAGKGLYFLSAILKDRETGELSNYIETINGNSAQEVVGTFVLTEEVKNSIIVSISYIKQDEKNVHNKGTMPSGSE
jgi:vacuolar-type H+-ATPase subunit I/STV1